MGEIKPAKSQSFVVRKAGYSKSNITETPSLYSIPDKNIIFLFYNVLKLCNINAN